MSFCTSAITGTDHPAHQPIYVCTACVPPSPDELPPCVCEACANIIGDHHDVDFVGVGPCTCDCPSLVEGGLFDDIVAGELRDLFARSMEEAERLGRSCPRPLNRPPPAGVDGPSERQPAGGLGGYAFRTFTISDLTERDCERLVRQATILVEHTKDTFWLPGDGSEDESELCELESLARRVYHQHLEAFDLDRHEGCEWWVQLKPEGEDRAPVDLHFDKDEELAESFSLGAFPTISTVTYLTGDGPGVAPTVVFPHTYTDDEEEHGMASVLLSRPSPSKHLAFDGRLLHGAPAGAAPSPPGGRETPSPLRVTFLVNIWPDRPSGTGALPDAVRAAVRGGALPGGAGRNIPGLRFDERAVTRLTLDCVGRRNVVLPFVSQGATWIDDGSAAEDGAADDLGPEVREDSIDDDESEEEEGELVLVMPAITTRDMASDSEPGGTLLVSFEGANEAKLVRR